MVRTSDVSGASRQLVPAELVHARLDAVLNRLTDTASNCGVATGGHHGGASRKGGNANHDLVFVDCNVVNVDVLSNYS